MTLKRSIAIVAMIMLVAALAAAQSFPAGTRFTVRVGQELSSEKATAGQAFEGSLAKDVLVNGQTVARAGAPVRGKVTGVKSSGRLKTPGRISVRLTSVDGKPVTTTAVGRQGKSHNKSNVTKIGGGAAAGALIGALAGGGKGAAIGTLAGGAAGTGVAAATGKQEAVIPAEATLTFTATAAQR